MNSPVLDANTAASDQAYAAIIQGVLTLVALAIAIGVPWWQSRRTAQLDQTRRDEELAGLRLALHTEVGVIALQCMLEQTSWAQAAAMPTEKNIRTAKLPQLVVYTANAGRIGLLSRGEIVSLIKFSSSLHDISIVVSDIERHEMRTIENYTTLRMLLSNACGSAADFFEAVPGIEGAEQDRDFVRELKARFNSMGDERARARHEFTASLMSVRKGGKGSGQAD